MDSRVLVPLDESPQAWTALEHALEEHADADITVLTVIDPIEAGYSAEAMFPSGSEEWYESQKEAAAERSVRAQEVADEYGVDLSTAIELGQPARTVVEYATEHDVDQIVMGSHGRSGVTRILLGSVAESIVRRSPVPVTVVR